ncbi:MAG: HAMP domain-containing histidine kinase [Oscillospiraceae bacterium]|nr:HAMP domain-containing histidine kinase [Oscillospiraceae bacterium]
MFNAEIQRQLHDMPYPALAGKNGLAYMANTSGKCFFDLGEVDFSQGIPLGEFISSGALEAIQDLVSSGHQTGRVKARVQSTEYHVNVKVSDNQMLLVFIPIHSADDAMPPFMQSMSVYIRNRLASLLAAVDSLKSGNVTDEPNKKYIAEVRRGALSLLRLSCNLNDTSRCFENVDYADPEPTDIDLLCRRCADETSGIAATLGISVSYSGIDNLPLANVEADKIERLLFNLISNSLHSVREGGKIDISLSRKGTNLILQVKDDGCGLDDESRACLFEKYRMFSPRNISPGLGLPLAAAYAEQHGGSIFASSKKGKGAVFTVTLPFSPADTAGVSEFSSPCVDYAGGYPRHLVELSDIPAYNPAYETGFKA